MIKRTSLTLSLAAILLLTSQSFAINSEINVLSTSNVEALRVEMKRSGSVSGTVKEAGTGEELIGANVIIKGTLKGTSVDIDGNFLIRNIEAGPQVLVVSYLGFQGKEIPIEVIDGENVAIDIELEPQGVVGEEVTITAQARGQVAAINQQLSSNTISNVVSKDRIEDVPDVNAAESIGRLPGVSIQRSNGEANKIAIRGLSPKYNTVSINGVRVPSTGDDRSVDLSLISSNMLDGIEVSKAITPDMDADALGGSVNLKLRTAPEELFTDFRIQGGYTGLQKELGNYKISASGGQRFLDSKIGLIANVNIDKYNRSADLFNSNPELIEDTQNDNLPTPSLREIRLQERDLERSRLGGSFIFDYKLPKGKLIVNSIYNKLDSEGFTRTNLLNAVSRRHTYSLSKNDSETSIFTFSTQLEQDFNWVNFDVGISKTSSKNESPKNYYWDFFEDNGADASQLGQRVLFGDPQNISPAFYNNIDNTFFNNLNVNSQVNEGDELTLHSNVTFPFDLNIVSGYLKVGAKYRTIDRTNDREQLGRGLYYGGDEGARDILYQSLPQLDLPEGNNLFSLSLFLDDYSRSNFLDGNYPLGYTLDPNKLLLVTSVLEDGFFFYNGQGSLGNDYQGSEEYGAVYAMANFEIGNSLTILPGVRYEQEETSYDAKFVLFNSPTNPGQIPAFRDTSASRSGSFVLPMVHLKYAPNDWLNIRLAYTESITRPDFSQYAPNTFVGQFRDYVNAPNTNLKTSHAKNFDASVSIYQNKVGFFTVSGFYKEIEDLIRFVSFPLKEDQTVLPDINIPNLNGEPRINTYVNNENPAYVKGIEFDWQTNFWYLPSVFKGLVLSFNYTIIQSETEYPAFYVRNVPIEPRPQRPPFNTQVLTDTTYIGRIPDQPSNIANVTIGYDYKGFSARLSYYFQNDIFTGNFGSRFFNDGVFTEGDDVFTGQINRLDFTTKQKINEQVEVYANLNNLTNEFDRNYQSSFGSYPTYLQYYGFTMDVGIRVKI